jgi:hypothetical protein
MSELTKEQQELLKRLTDEMMNLATEVVQDYEENPSEMSGSIVAINENSPFLEESIKGDSWKKVIIGSVEEALNFVKSNDASISEDEEPIEDQATKDRKRWSG